MILMSPVV